MANLIDELIAQFDCMTDPIGLYDVRSRIIGATMGAQLSLEEQTSVDAEVAAFTLHFPHDGKSPWGTSFAPLRIRQPDGCPVIYDPDLARLNSETVDLWACRARACKNPVLVSRYADLVWDLEQKIVGNAKRRVEFALLAFEAYFQAVRDGLFSLPPYTAQALVRALELAREMNDKGKVSQATEAIFEFGKTAPAPLLATFSKVLFAKNKPDSATTDKICLLLEQRLVKVVSEDHQMEVESAVHALRSIYQKKEDGPNCQRIAKTYGVFYMRKAEAAGSALAIGWLIPVVKLYIDVHLYEDADEVLLYIENRGSTMSDEMGVIHTEISEEDAAKAETEANAAVDHWLDSPDLFLAIFRASRWWLYDPNSVREMLAQTAEDFPFLSMMPQLIINEQGMPVANIGGLEDDPEGKMVEMYVRLMQLRAPILDIIWTKAREKFALTEEQLVDALKPSVLFEPSREGFFRQGFAAFNAGDYLKSIHILVPQVENMMRKFLRVLGVPTIKFDGRKPGILEFKNLSESLNHPRVAEALEERIWLFLKILYNDKLGYNLRNEMAHGIASINTFNRYIAAMVIQSVFLLSVLSPERCYITEDDRKAMSFE